MKVSDVNRKEKYEFILSATLKSFVRVVLLIFRECDKIVSLFCSGFGVPICFQVLGDVVNILSPGRTACFLQGFIQSAVL